MNIVKPKTSFKLELDQLNGLNAIYERIIYFHLLFFPKYVFDMCDVRSVRFQIRLDRLLGNLSNFVKWILGLKHLDNHFKVNANLLFMNFKT